MDPIPFRDFMIALAEGFIRPSRTRRVKAYDMQYVAASEAEGRRLVTIDGGMRQAATELGVQVAFLR
jgi:predicted nucleic acid-binding protein